MKPYANIDELNHYLDHYQLQGIIPQPLKKAHIFQSYAPKELLCQLGEPVCYFRILLTGRVKVFTTSSEGKILSLHILQDLTNLGDIEIMTGTNYRCHVEALSPTLCIAFPIDLVKKVALDHNPFLRYLCRDLCQKFDDIASATSNNILYPLRNRLVSYMMEYLDGKTMTIRFPYSHTALAELLGITYRHLTRSLGELETKKLVRLQDGVIHVLDEEGLRLLEMDAYPYK